jgi:hypothetical protein
MQYKHNYYAVLSALLIILFLTGSSIHSQVNKKNTVQVSTKPSEKYYNIKLRQHLQSENNLKQIYQSFDYPVNPENFLRSLSKREAGHPALNKLNETFYSVDTAFVYSGDDTTRYSYSGNA